MLGSGAVSGASRGKLAGARIPYDSKTMFAGASSAPFSHRASLKEDLTSYLSFPCQRVFIFYHNIITIATCQPFATKIIQAG
ncbi:hypothetical protein EFR42_00645 [Lactobacillus delbrueckii]|nr:hypothetical protein [Lactobacillus delbrueckii]MCT3491192.1 hypothetical protein [Lactobacillus delbrueckii]